MTQEERLERIGKLNDDQWHIWWGLEKLSDKERSEVFALFCQACRQKESNHDQT